MILPAAHSNSPHTAGAEKLQDLCMGNQSPPQPRAPTGAETRVATAPNVDAYFTSYIHAFEELATF